MGTGSPISPKIEANITLASILIYAGSMSFGFFALPSLMIGETQPSHVRGFTCGYIYTMNDLLLGAVVKLYPWLSSSLQIHGLFMFFGISCVMCTIFVYLFLPETQGLTLQQIEDYFRQPNIMWVTRNKYANDEESHKNDMSVNRVGRGECS
jgi:SP family facilitated glucose transporter-like MFS transporter 8